MRVLLADDDRDLVDLLAYIFKREGFTPIMAFDGNAALQAAEMQAPDVIVMDLTMPKRDGMQALKELRRGSQVPVVVLTAIGDEEHLVQALELGADDYLVKPFRHRELLARVVRLVKRQPNMVRRDMIAAQQITCGEIAMDAQRREVCLSGQPLRLTRTEFNLLHYLMLNKDIVVGVSEIISNVWGYDAEVTEDAVQVGIARLRRKLESDPAHPRYITTSQGAGYLFQVPKDPP